MTISLIVAMSRNRVIGRDGEMPWHLSADLRRFKRLTMGHHMIMGRKTFDSIGRVLPGRTTIVLTRDKSFKQEDALVAHSLDSAIAMATGDDEIFVVGGGGVYREALPLATQMYVTRVCADLEGDTTFPEIDWSDWERLESTRQKADGNNNFDYAFEVYARNGAGN